MKKNSKDAIPATTAKTYVHKGFFDVRIDTVEQGDLSANYTVLCTKARAAAVLGKTCSGDYLLIKEYRYPSGRWVYSLPGGRIDKGESSKNAAQRELLEETGYQANTFTPLFVHLPMPSVADQEIDVFYAKDCSLSGETALDPWEKIEPILLDETSLLSLMKKESSAVDSLLSASLFYLLLSKGLLK
ncbi:MAG: NUDIX hydrolase [Chlamydiota bacterium]